MTAYLIESSEQAPPGAPEPNEAAGGLWWLVRASGSSELLAAVHLQPDIGRSRPRYSFHIGRVVHAAAELGLYQVQTTLQLGHDATAEAELSAWWAAPQIAPAALDALLQQVLRHHSRNSQRRLLAELPGTCDELGRSPFWEGLVRPFLPVGAVAQVEAARLRLGASFSSHLGAMLPRQLIHAVFLPEAAQQALGQCLPSLQPWLEALERAGFKDWRHCRIDDGGPLLAL